MELIMSEEQALSSEVQEQLNTEVDKQVSEFSAEDTAAKIFMIFLPQFKQLIRSMSVRQLKRLIAALIETPLEDTKYKHPTEEERAAFMLGTRLLEAKMVMMTSVYAEKMAEARKTQEASSLNTPPPGAVPVENFLQNVEQNGNINSSEGDK